MEKFQKSLGLFFEQYQPRDILYIGKIFGEYYPRLVPTNSSMTWTNLFLREPSLRAQEDAALPFSNIQGTFHMTDTLDEAIQVISSLSSFDLVLMDTVHDMEYIRTILATLVDRSLAPYLILHDAVPHFKEWTTPSRSCGKIPWCGETYKAIFEFHLRYPETTRIVRDGHAGYAFLRLWNIRNVPPPVDTATDLITFERVQQESETHDDFFQDALQSKTWVDAPAPSRFPLRQMVQRIHVVRGVSFHVFWKDFTVTENRRGPSLSVFVHGREKFKFDFQGASAHYHLTDEKGRDSGRLPFSSSSFSLTDHIQEMKTLLAPPVEWEDALEHACRKLWSLHAVHGIKLVINSHIKSKLALDHLIESLRNQPLFSSIPILVFIGGCPIAKETIGPDHVHYIDCPFHAVDKTALVGILERFPDPTEEHYFFVMHDTCRAGPLFLEKIVSLPWDGVSSLRLLEKQLSMNMGVYSLRVIHQHKEFLYSMMGWEEDLQHKKTVSISNEDYIFDRDPTCGYLVSLEIPMIRSEPQDYYQTGTLRVVRYYPPLDLYKIKANWELKPVWALGI